MAESSHPLNKNTVKELVLDEQKMLTYITLSKDYGIHVNEAKKVLNEFVQEIKTNEPEIKLNVIYMITGLTGNNSARTTICSESDLEAERSNFETVFFQHIYSVSQGLPKVDSAAIVSLNRFEDFALCAGLIKSNSCIKRSTDEIGTLKYNGQSIEPKSNVPLKKENSKLLKNKDDYSKDVVKVHECKPVPTIKTETVSPKKVSTSNSNGKSIAKNGNKSSKSIAGFFNKSNSNPNAKISNSTQIVKSDSATIKGKSPEPVVNKNGHIKVEHEINDEQMEVDEDSAKIKKTETVCLTKNSNNNDSTVKGKVKKNNSLNNIKKNAKVDKKRKRVLHVSDSDSDEANDPFADEQKVNNESEDEIPPTPTISTVKITSGILNPKKRRKIVDKTYTDEEGYILTRKEEIYESCSDDEVQKKDIEPTPVTFEKENVQQTNKDKTDSSPKGIKPKNVKKKMSPPRKGKQATIMNFFRKA